MSNDPLKSLRCFYHFRDFFCPALKNKRKMNVSLGVFNTPPTAGHDRQIFCVYICVNVNEFLFLGETDDSFITWSQAERPPKHILLFISHVPLLDRLVPQDNVRIRFRFARASLFVTNTHHPIRQYKAINNRCSCADAMKMYKNIYYLTDFLLRSEKDIDLLRRFSIIYPVSDVNCSILCLHDFWGNHG